MTGTEIYKRTPVFDREAPTIRLHAPEWKLLLAHDGQRSLSEVALASETSFAEALALTETFLTHGWIEEQPITLDQYLKRTGAAPLTGAAIPPAVVLHRPRIVEPAPTLAPLVAKPAPGQAPSMAVPPPAPHRAPISLRAVVDFIVGSADSIALGQLMAYRVFLRVPPDLLQAEDIGSVRLDEDPGLVKTEPLQRAIAAAVVEVVKKPLPESLFAAG